MDVKYRKIIYKIPGLHSLCRRIVDIQNVMFYKKFVSFTHHDEILKSMKGVCKDRRCFIVGNGPSLTMEDLRLIKDEDCFAANLIFKIFDDTEWRPMYYFLQDRYADTGNVVDNLDVEKLFIGDYYWRTRGMTNPRAVCFHGKRGAKTGIPEFSSDISEYIVDHHTVTYSMIQCAVYMGYEEIYLIGMDHNFALTCDEKGNIIGDTKGRSHVFVDDNPQEVVANIVGMNKAYIAARDYARANGIKIVNCTRGGKLEWFERDSLENVLSRTICQ